MATFVMLGKYSPEGLRGISAKRSDQAKALIKQSGGELKAVYALLGQFDLVVIAELPTIARAMQTSMAMTKLLGVDFTTAPAVTLEEFDELTG